MKIIVTHDHGLNEALEETAYKETSVIDIDTEATFDEVLVAMARALTLEGYSENLTGKLEDLAYDLHEELNNKFRML